jgi:hypothetical protein
MYKWEKTLQKDVKQEMLSDELEKPPFDTIRLY